jgi:hypothetical protein
VIDYFLPAAATGPVTLEILDGQGKLVRHFSSDDKPDVTDDDLQKQLIPLYWIRPFHKLSSEAGMHRWVWGLHYPPPVSRQHEYPISAIPHDTPRYPLGPTVLPGSYKVRLTVNGKSLDAPLTVKMDPRVKTTAAGLEKKFQAEMRLAAILSETSQAVFQAESIRDQLEKLDHANDSTKDAIDSFQKKLSALLGASGGFMAPPAEEVTLTRVNGQANTLYGQVWQVDAEPTVPQSDAMTAVAHDSADALKRWNALKNSDLPGLNRLLRQSNTPEIKTDTGAQHDDNEGDEE